MKQRIMRETGTKIKNEKGWSCKTFTITGDTIGAINEARKRIIAIIARTKTWVQQNLIRQQF